MLKVNIFMFIKNIYVVITKMLENYEQNVRAHRCNIAIINYDYFILTETTWLNDSIFNSKLSFDNYVIYRLDRNINIIHCQISGGIAICIKDIYVHIHVR
jgi:hypothetical protein